MSKTQINFQLLEMDEENSPFEDLISEIEKRFLQSDNPVMKAQLEQTLLYLERQCQDYQSVNKMKSQVIYEAVRSVALISVDTNYSIAQIAENIRRVKTFSYQLITMKPENVYSYSVFSTLKKENPKKRKIELDQIHDMFNKIFKIEEINKKNEWDIEFVFEIPREESHKPLQFLNAFIEGLNLIEGVTVILEDISVGSLKAKMKAVFDDVSSREEVKELLESARLFAKGKLEKEFYESEKLESEAEKTKIESDILKENLIDIQSPETREIRRLESESLKYDVERKKLENEDMKLDLFKKKKDILKELLSEGFIEQKNMEILINDLPYLSMINGTLMIGSTLNDIEENH